MLQSNATLLLLILGFFTSCQMNQPNDQSESETPILTLNDRGVMCSSAVTDIQWYLDQSKAPIFTGLDVLDYSITTNSPEAQDYFNQGLVLAYAFNHAEAARSFYEAIRADSTCAMCHWGFAYVLGPNYNAGMEPDNFERAFQSIQNALVYSENVTQKEAALIGAMAQRYSADPPEDRSELDQAYSDAMALVYDKYPDDPEVAALYAESLLDLHPWDLYDDNGLAKSWTPGILEALNKTLALDPNHLGAHHLYIHAVEASSNPEQGLMSAKMFDEGLVPGAGHLVHMPSHIYIRTGDYHKGTLANIRAVSIDSSYLSQCHAQGAYPLAYYPHNMHFLAACAMYAGNGYWATVGANAVSDHASRSIMKEDGWGTLQHYYSIPYYIAVKFGKWDAILNMKNFDTSLKYPEAIRHFARGMAFLSRTSLTEAKTELADLKRYAEDESLKEVSIWGINNTYTIVQIAYLVLKAEIRALEGELEASVQFLVEALEIEDGLQYQEPTDWLLSVRHHLGAVLVEGGRYHEALEVYKTDLVKLPKNGWAYKGMVKSYEALNLIAEMRETEELFEEAWSESDIEIDGSRILYTP